MASGGKGITDASRHNGGNGDGDGGRDGDGDSDGDGKGSCNTIDKSSDTVW